MKKPLFKEIKNYTGQIFTTIIILALISYLFVNIGIKDHLDESFWTIFIIGFCLMLAITMIWYPLAKEKEERTNKNFYKNKLEYSLLVQQVVDTSNHKGLKRFSEKATEINKNDAIKNKLAKYNLDYTLYLKYVNQEQKEDGSAYNINDVANEKNLDDRQKKMLRKIIINGLSYKFLGFNFKGYKTINHNSITTGIDKLKSRYDVENEEKSFDRKMMSAKIITSIIFSFGFALIAFSGKGFDLGKLAQIITWVGLIFFNIFTAINNGKKSIAVYRNDYFKKLRTFLEEFITSEYYDKSIEWHRPQIKDEVTDEQKNL